MEFYKKILKEIKIEELDKLLGEAERTKISENMKEAYEFIINLAKSKITQKKCWLDEDGSILLYNLYTEMEKAGYENPYVSLKKRGVIKREGDSITATFFIKIINISESRTDGY